MSRSLDIKQRVSNRYLHYSLNRGLGAYTFQKTAEYKNGSDLGEVALEVILVLRKNKIPIHWLVTVMAQIEKGEVVLPDHECMAIKVGNKFIFESNYDPKDISSLKGLPVEIALTGYVSKTEIKNFIESHSKLIEKITIELELPDVQKFTGNSFQDNLLADMYRDLGYPVSEVVKLIDPKNDDNGDLSTTKRKIKRGRKTRDML